MSDPLKRLSRGDPLPLSAATWNAILDSVRDRSKPAKPTDINRRVPGTVRIKNSTGQTLERGSVVFVDTADDPEITATDSIDQFQSTIILKGRQFGASDQQPPTAYVLSAPCNPNEIVVAYCTGIVATLIDVQDAADEFVEYKASATTFQTADSGWPIIWKQSGVGLKHAYVLLVKNSETNMVPLSVYETGGYHGDCDTPCAFRYTVKNAITDELYYTNINPNASPHRYQRPPVGELVPAIAGIGYFKEISGTSTLIINHIHEPLRDPCAGDHSDTEDSNSESNSDADSSSDSASCFRIPGVDLASLPTASADDVEFVLGVVGGCLVKVPIGDCLESGA